MKENQIDSVGLLKVNFEGAERLLIGSFEKISKVKHVAISCHDFLYKRSGDKNLKQKNLSFAFWKIVILALPEQDVYRLCRRLDLWI